MAAALFLGAGSAPGMINPSFTPLNLLGESVLVAEVSVADGTTNALFTAKVTAVLKGNKDTQDFVLDCSKAVSPDMAQFAAALIRKSSAAPALFFVGKFAADPQEGDDDPGGGRVTTKGFLHTGGKWIEFAGSGTRWRLAQISAHMEGTWAGGTDMLLRAIRYAQSDETADFPVKAGAAWKAPVKVGNAAGIGRLRPVDLAGNGHWHLFATSPQGDRLYGYDAGAKSLREITSSRALSSRSTVAVWADFDGKGGLDLVGGDGAVLSLFCQQEDGTLASGRVILTGEVAMACRDLAALDVGGKAGLLIGGQGGPWLIRDVMAENVKAERMAADAGLAAGLGAVVSCVAADLDGDAVPDALQVCEKGSLWFKGKSVGDFLPGEKCAVAAGRGGAAVALADMDADGRLDVFTAGAQGEHLWQNEGGGLFADRMRLSGEMPYISKPNGVDCAVCDVNNDGRQDVLIAYGDIGAQIFFNRGFRSFGHAHELDLAEKELLVAAAAGQRTACIADFTGDGAQDMALGLPDGDIWFFERATDSGSALHAAVALPMAGPCKGSVTVSGVVGGQNLGAWNVQPGVAEAFFGMKDAGMVAITWRLPGGETQSRQVLVRSKPVRVELGSSPGQRPVAP